MKKYPHVGRLLIVTGGSLLLLSAISQIVVDRHISARAWQDLVEAGVAFVLYFLLKKQPLKPTA